MVKSNVVVLRIRPKKTKRVKREIDKAFKILRDYIIPLHFVYELKALFNEGRKRQNNQCE